MDSTITGRLTDGWVSGRFMYENFAQVPEVTNALTKGIFTHYLIGIICAFGFLLVTGAMKLRRGLGVSIAFGLATTVFSAFLLFPSVGLGVFALKSPSRLLLIRSSLFNHLFFGLDLFFGIRIWSLARRIAGPQQGTTT